MTIRLTIKHEDINAERSVLVTVRNAAGETSQTEVCPGQKGEFHVYDGQTIEIDEVIPADADETPVAGLSVPQEQVPPTVQKVEPEDQSGQTTEPTGNEPPAELTGTGSDQPQATETAPAQ